MWERRWHERLRFSRTSLELAATWLARWSIDHADAEVEGVGETAPAL